MDMIDQPECARFQFWSSRSHRWLRWRSLDRVTRDRIRLGSVPSLLAISRRLYPRSCAPARRCAAGGPFFALLGVGRPRRGGRPGQRRPWDPGTGGRAHRPGAISPFRFAGPARPERAWAVRPRSACSGPHRRPPPARPWVGSRLAESWPRHCSCFGFLHPTCTTWTYRARPFGFLAGGWPTSSWCRTSWFPLIPTVDYQAFSIARRPRRSVSRTTQDRYRQDRAGGAVQLHLDRVVVPAPAGRPRHHRRSRRTWCARWSRRSSCDLR
jgi:hypothetical protein